MRAWIVGLDTGGVGTNWNSSWKFDVLAEEGEDGLVVKRAWKRSATHSTVLA